MLEEYYIPKYEKAIENISAQDNLQKTSVDELELTAKIRLILYKNSLEFIGDFKDYTFVKLSSLLNHNIDDLKFLILSIDSLVTNKLSESSYKKGMDWYFYLVFTQRRIKDLDSEVYTSDIPYSYFSSGRTSELLIGEGIITYRDFAEFSPFSMYEIQGIGPKTVYKICDYLISSISDVRRNTPKNINVEEIAEEKSQIVVQKDDPLTLTLKSMNDSLLDMNISSSDVRLNNCLLSAGIHTYRDILNYGPENLFHIHGFGRRTFRMLTQVVRDLSSIDFNGEDLSSLNNYYFEYISSLKDEALNYDFSSMPEVQFSYESKRLELIDALLDKASVLTSRQRDIYRQRLATDITLEELGNKYGVSRERIRQIFSKVNKSMIASFTNSLEYLSSKPVQRFYEILCNEKPLIPFFTFLVRYDDVISDILLRICKLHHLEEISSYSAKQASNQSNKNSTYLSLEMENNFRELKRWPLFDAIRNVGDVREVIPERIQLLESGMPKNIELYDCVRKLMSHYKNMRFISYPKLNEELSADGAIVINEKVVVLLIQVESEDDLVSDNILSEDKKLMDYCKDVGYGYLIFNGKNKNLHSLVTRRIDPIVEIKLKTALQNASSTNQHQVSYICETYNLKKPDVLSIGLKDEYAFKTNPLRIYFKDDIDYVSFNDIDKKLAKIKYRSFSQFEIVVLHALVVLTEHYATRRNKLWFSTIRVFLTGTNTSHLYQQCKSLPYFGHEPNVKNAELMSALNNFVDLELINEFKNNNSKSYYEINTELISKSHILDDNDNSSFDDDFNID